MWFEDAYAVSDGINCYPTPTALSTFNNYGPIQNFETKLQMTANRVVMAAYQLGWMVSKLNINGQYVESTTFTEERHYYLSQNSLLAKGSGLREDYIILVLPIVQAP